MKRFIILFYFIFIGASCFSQNVGIGADIQYNFQSESFGTGARISLFPNNKISFVPEFSYYFSFNKVNEYFLGLAIEYKFIRQEKFHLYALIHGGYENWINYNESPMKNAKPNNWDLEGGIGISTNKCLRPFLEYRYNVRFMETHLRLGIMYIFGCKQGSSRSHERCAAYS